MSNIVVVGSANADLVVSVPRRPNAGETLLGGELATIPGGKGANQAVAAAKAGGGITFIGAVGRDTHGDLLIASLKAAGVDTDSVIVSDRPTGTAIIVVTPDGENSIVVSRGAGAECTTEHLSRLSQVWREADVIVLSLEIAKETVEFVTLDAHAHNTRVVLNAAPAIPLTERVLLTCDPLIVNEHEAVEMLGGSTNTPEILARELLALGPASVVVTLGAQGAVVADAEETTHLPAYPANTIDTTGAGDAFVGAVAAELAAGRTLREAVGFGQAMAALSVQQLGAQTSYVEASTVRKFMDESI